MGTITLTKTRECADIGARIVKTATGLTKYLGHTESTIRLEIGDFVVVHETIGTWSAESNLTRLTIEKILEV